MVHLWLKHFAAIMGIHPHIGTYFQSIQIRYHHPILRTHFRAQIYKFR